MMLLTLALPWLVACNPAPAEAPAEAPVAEAPAAEAPAEVAPRAATTITLSDVRARASAPGAPNGAAFLTLTNAGAPTALVSASASVSDTVELHTHIEVDGVMQMRAVPSIPLMQGRDTVLRPGGLHIMFIGLKAPLEEGQSFPLTLTFADGSTTTVDVPVQAVQTAPMDHGSH